MSTQKLKLYKDSTGYEKHYDSNGNKIHYKDSNGFEEWWEYYN